MRAELQDNVVMAPTEYGVVLLDEKLGAYYNLNPTGALILRTLLDGGDTDDAVRALTDSYQVDPADAAADVADLLEQLRTAQLLRSAQA